MTGLAFVPDPLPPARLEATRGAVLDRLWPLLDQAKSGLIRLDASVAGLPNPKVVLGAMRMREAQASSRIENTVASIPEVVMAGIGVSRGLEQALEVHLNRRAIERGLESELPICGQLVRDMHRVLVRDPRQRPGQFRDRQVYIGDEVRGFASARFVPPPPGELDTCLRDWERYVNSGADGAPARARWPDLIELGLAHYQFEAIHPFSDGNGRLGRALVNLGPVKAGWLKQTVCNLSEWVQSHRREYYDRLLRVSTHGEWEAWLEFFLRAIGGQAELDLARVERLTALADGYRRKLTVKRSSAVVGRLIDHLFEQPAVTIPLAAEVMGVTYPSAKRHVESLVERGVLRQVGGGKYGKVYLAVEVVRAIEGHEPG